jgi:hypothetical protein
MALSLRRLFLKRDAKMGGWNEKMAISVKFDGDYFKKVHKT